MTTCHFRETLIAAKLRAEVGMESALKQMRMMWVFFLLADLVFVALPELVGASVRPMLPMLYLLLSALVLADLVAFVIVRKVFVSRAEEILRTNANDRVAIMRWRQGQLATMAMGAAIVLYGLLIRFLGGDKLHAIPFYVVGIVATVVFKPAAVQ